MVRSIRGRLVVGTMVLTLLSVSVVGVVSLLLMQRYMVQQERAYLTANAEAIARQAASFMTPVHAAPPLQQLAQTAAFLGDASVRIVDQAQTPLADSSAMATYSATASLAAAPFYIQIGAASEVGADGEFAPAMPPPVVWRLEERDMMVQMHEPVSMTLAQAVVPEDEVAVAHASMPGPDMPHAGMPSAGIPSAGIPSANVIVVQRSPSIWGNRLTFNAEFLSVTGTMTTVVPSVISAQPAQWGAVPGEAVAASAEMAGVPSSAPGRPSRVAVGSGRAVQPSFWEAVGFQASEVVTAPIRAGGRMDGATIGFVEVQRATGLVDEPLGAIRRALAIAAGASSLLALAVGLVMSGTLTAPIQTLAQTAAAMSNGDLTARAPVVGHDELAALARQFNQMADALHRSFAELAAERDTLRRFVADASHELRTPITALRTFNELLQGPAREDACAQAEFLAESQVQIARLEWITRNLLDLSRWEGGMATLVLAPVEIGEMVTATVTPFRALAQERDIELSVTMPETPVVATVDEQRLALVVANLLDNALKFTNAGGRVEVGVQADAEQVTVWVADTGVGIDADDLPHIFDRFYRSPRATQSGSGLGLAIVAHIVDAHQATIDVTSEVGAGSRFTLCLPVSA